MAVELETDYLVVGGGASGMAFVDTVLALSDADIVLVDRRHRPGGHWLDAYPFVRIHQTSATYGVPSRRLGQDRIDEIGPNAGFYERATAAAICAYYTDVLEDVFEPSGRVRFLPMCDYQGHDADGHHVVSLLSGERTTIRVRRRLVDATYVESSIPSKHRPPFSIDDSVRVVPPNDLVDLGEAPAGFTIIGCGKTAIDTCDWLLATGVDPNRIQWIRPRDPWLLNRRYTQPLELVASSMQLQAHWVEAAAAADNGRDFAHRLESGEVFLRIDDGIEPHAWRGATVSTGELDAVRTIERVVHNAKITHLGSHDIVFQNDQRRANPNDIYVDCTAAGVRPTVQRPVFEPERITLQYTTIGNIPHGAATIGAVEALRDNDDDKNRLCPTLVFTGDITDILTLTHSGISGITARVAEPDLVAWNDACRLNAIRDANQRRDDPTIARAFDTIITNIGPALENLARHTQAGPS